MLMLELDCFLNRISIGHDQCVMWLHIDYMVYIY